MNNVTPLSLKVSSVFGAMEVVIGPNAALLEVTAQVVPMSTDPNSRITISATNIWPSQSHETAQGLVRENDQPIPMEVD